MVVVPVMVTESTGAAPMSQVAVEATLADPARNRVAPVVLSIASAVFQLAPSGETLSVRSSSPISPISALPEKAALHEQRKYVASGLLVQRVSQVSVAAFGERQRRPQRLVQLGGEKIGPVRRGPDAEPGEILEHVDGVGRVLPGAAGPAAEERFVGEPGQPAGARCVESQAPSCQAATCPSRPPEAPDPTI